MLREHDSVRQDQEGLRRRWFFDDFFDVILWEDPSGVLTGFHLSYDKNGTERLLEWKGAGPLAHFRVDSAGDQAVGRPRTPTLRPELGPVPEDLVEGFAEVLGDPRPNVLEALLGILQESGLGRPSDGIS